MADFMLTLLRSARLPRRGAELFLAAVLLGVLVVPAAGCKGDGPLPPGFERVTIDGREYKLELAVDDEKRTKGLGGRASLPENGGMLFVFRRPARRQFIMRDCLIDVDIIFLDASARITAMHHMPKEEPRGPDEGVAGDWDPAKAANRRYESRLKRYSSKGATQFVIEIPGGHLEKMKLRAGQRIELDTDRLKALAR